jgi:CHAT domain-containing protein
MCLAALFLLTMPTAGQESGSPTSLLVTVRSLLEDGQYQKAEHEAERLVSSVNKAKPSDRSEILDAQDLLVQALTLNAAGGFDRARALAEYVVQARAGARAGDAPASATSLRNLGDVLLQAGDYRAAIDPYKRATDVRERAVGPDSADLADDLDHLARALAFVEQHGEALTIANRALRIKEQVLPPGDVRIARTLEVQALVLQRMGEYAKVRPPLERALAIREKVGPAHPEIAGTLSLLGEQFWFEGDPVRSESFSKRAMAIADRTLRPGHPEFASYLRRLALSVADLGDVAEAHRLRERALAIAEKSLGLDHPVVALQLNDLAVSLLGQGDYATARTLLERARRVYERRLGPDYSGVTAAVFNLAVISAALGDYLEARRAYEHSIATWERVLGPEHPFVAYGLSTLADMLEQQGHHNEAERSYARSLAITEKRVAKDHVDVAITLTRLANAVYARGDLGRALEISTRAVSIWEQSPARESRGAAAAFLMHGTIQDRLGQSAAQTSLSRALEILQRTEAPPQDVATAQVALASSLARDGNPTRAIEYALEAEARGRAHLLLTTRYLPERQALTMAGKRPKALDLAISLATNAPSMAASVLDRVIRSRAVILDEMAERNHRAVYASSGETAQLAESLTAAKKRLANLVVRGQGRQPKDQYVALVDRARREKETAETALAAKSAVFRAELASRDVGLDAVRNALAENAALLSVIRYDRSVNRQQRLPTSKKASAGVRPDTLPAYLAFVLRPGTREPVAVSLGDAAMIDKLVDRWRSEMMAGLARTPGSTRTAERSLRAIGSELRQRIWDPVAAHLGDANRVFVVPDGVLNLVPFAAFPMGQTEYLLEAGPTIHYLSAERDLVTSGTAREIGTGLLALGGASFGGAPVVAQTPSKTTTYRSSAPDCVGFQSMRFRMLPASQKEAAAVATLWKEFGQDSAVAFASTQVLAGSEANERTFKELSPGRRVLHLATHGYFLESACRSALDGTRAVGGLTKTGSTAARARTTGSRHAMGENPLLFSGLALAGANRRTAVGPDEEDGILTAEEVASLSLDGVQWAVLSACDTGLGEIKAGEGVFGLRRAFQVAGARTVIMSLWSVEDRSAMDWMRALYESRLRRHLDTADAVREASVTVLKQRRARGRSTHPFFWAGFVASGDWR